MPNARDYNFGNLDIGAHLPEGKRVTITVEAFHQPLVRRGHYISFNYGDAAPILTRAVRSSGSMYDETSVTARFAHGWRWVEWLHAQWEDRIAWPLSDWRARRK